MAQDRQPGDDGAGDNLTGRLRARLARARLRGRQCRLPARLRRRLDATADAWIRRELATGDALAEPPPQPPPSTRVSRTGWYVAAVCLVLAVVGWWPRLDSLGHDALHGRSPFAPAAERGRQQLLDRAGPQLGRWAWAHESGLPPGVEGEVVWDPEQQEGYLTLSGLEPSLPSGQQYQLWIFDAARDDRYPVDGGVFDVPVDDRMITVPIRPALPVHAPVAFAVTLEPAGGVVVSDRTHLIAMARTTPR
ncbi:MAG TPA: anti-sigma factor [Steroidobacteraceae bacterium]|nr:anti-sigma factor [Steroidobacteraceae bacterium]